CRPRFSSSMPIEALVSPFPRELTTPPVTKMNLVIGPQVVDTRKDCSSKGNRHPPIQPMLLEVERAGQWAAKSLQIAHSGAGGPVRERQAFGRTSAPQTFAPP